VLEAFGLVLIAPPSVAEASRAVQAEAVGSSRVRGGRFVAADSLFCAASTRVGQVRLARRGTQRGQLPPWSLRDLQRGHTYPFGVGRREPDRHTTAGCEVDARVPGLIQS
jgi:hypothetical protein